MALDFNSPDCFMMLELEYGTRVFLVHHSPNSGKYQYGADPHDAVASARALLREEDGGWVAGNCWRRIRTGDLLLFKFSSTKLLQQPGVYVAASVSRPPLRGAGGVWRFRYRPDQETSTRLIEAPLVGRDLEALVSRSFGQSIQEVKLDGVTRLARYLERRGIKMTLPRPRFTRVTHGLVILKEPLDLILAGRKRWELRGRATKLRGRIALIESGSLTVVGTCDLVDCVGPVALADLNRKISEWDEPGRRDRLPYPKTYGWVIENARRLEEPVPYRHPNGAVIWVRLTSAVSARLAPRGASSSVAGRR